MRYASSAMTQMSAELEESAHVCGASWWQTFRRVIFEQFENGQFTLLAAIGVLMVLILVVLVFVAYRIGATVGLRTDD